MVRREVGAADGEEPREVAARWRLVPQGDGPHLLPRNKGSAGGLARLLRGAGHHRSYFRDEAFVPAADLIVPRVTGDVFEGDSPGLVFGDRLLDAVGVTVPASRGGVTDPAERDEDGGNR